MTPPPVAEPAAWRYRPVEHRGEDAGWLFFRNALIQAVIDRPNFYDCEPLYSEATLSAETAARVKAEGERDEARADAKYRTGIEASALDKIAELKARVRELEEALRQTLVAENSNARRMREAIVEARRRLAKGRALWNGPCHECDGVLDQALRADNDADAIARRALLADGQPKP